MKVAMLNKDIEKVVSFFLTASQDKYRNIFTSLLNSLPEIAAGMKAIEMIGVENGIAEYRIKRIDGADEVTFYIYFAQDADGLWKIQQF